MPLHFNSLAIVCRRTNTSSSQALIKLIDYLHQQQVNLSIEAQSASLFPDCQLPILSPEAIGKNCDLIISVGGDGSFLSAARIAAKNNLPIIGINRGSLGFLSDITIKSLDKIGEILAGSFHTEERIVLEVQISSNHSSNSYLAANDVVILSPNTASILELLVYVDHQFLCRYRADGLIVATPTGSTAHALSGGGPILYPTLNNLVLVPILSHNLSSRPIVVGGDSQIEVRLGNGRNRKWAAVCDGQNHQILEKNNLVITKAKETLRLLHPKGYNYFNILRTKLNWEKAPTTLTTHND